MARVGRLTRFRVIGWSPFVERDFQEEERLLILFMFIIDLDQSKSQRSVQVLGRLYSIFASDDWPVYFCLH